MTTTEVLIHKTAAIQKRYLDIETKMGERFNLFSLLRIEKAETQHSRIIAEFLNPKGSHGQGAIYLKAFVETFNLKVEGIENAIVQTEKYLGKINDLAGGRIDILIDNIEPKIIIENKIEHTDEPAQLKRYNSYYPNGIILYLTLDGKKPATQSYEGLKRLIKPIANWKPEEGNAKEFIFQISYKTELLEWLVACKNLSSGLPLIREFIEHYIITIKKLTNQTRNIFMEQEIEKLILSSEDSLNAALGIKAGIEKINRIIFKAWVKIREPRGELKEFHDNAGEFSTTRPTKDNIGSCDLGFKFKGEIVPGENPRLEIEINNDSYRIDSHIKNVEGKLKEHLDKLMSDFEIKSRSETLASEDQIIGYVKYRLTEFEKSLQKYVDS